MDVVLADGDTLASEPGPDPAQALGSLRAAIGAEQGDYPRCVRLDHEEPDQDEQDQGYAKKPAEQVAKDKPALVHRATEHQEREDRPADESQTDEQTQIALGRARWHFAAAFHRKIGVCHHGSPRINYDIIFISRRA